MENEKDGMRRGEAMLKLQSHEQHILIKTAKGKQNGELCKCMCKMFTKSICDSALPVFVCVVLVI